MHILQYNKIKGVKEGEILQLKWNEDRTQFQCEDQIAEEINGEQYKVAVVNPNTGDIIEWRDVSLMNVKSSIEEQ